LQRAEPFAAQGIQKAFNKTAKGGKKVSLADLIVLAGCAATDKAARKAGITVRSVDAGKLDAVRDN
jgi:catalase-peroxidase